MPLHIVSVDPPRSPPPAILSFERGVSTIDTRDLMRHANADLTVSTYQRDDGEARAERLRRAVGDCQ